MPGSICEFYFQNLFDVSHLRTFRSRNFLSGASTNIWVRKFLSWSIYGYLVQKNYFFCHHVMFSPGNFCPKTSTNILSKKIIFLTSHEYFAQKISCFEFPRIFAQKKLFFRTSWQSDALNPSITSLTFFTLYFLLLTFFTLYFLHITFYFLLFTLPVMPEYSLIERSP